MSQSYLNNPCLSITQLTQAGNVLVHLLENTYSGVSIYHVTSYEASSGTPPTPLLHHARSCSTLLTHAHPHANPFIVHDSEGFIHIYQLQMTPLMGLSAKTASAEGILILDMTQYIQLGYLMMLYQSAYHNPHEMAQQFSNYLNLHDYFTTQLHATELAILVAMTTRKEPECIAQQLKYSLSTVLNGIEAIHTKLETNITLNHVIHRLKRN